MEQVVPWKALVTQIEPHYPRSGRAGGPPYAMDTMLRIHLLQQRYALSDPGMEKALHEIVSMRLFARLSGFDPIPDETTILNFRRLLETHGVAAKMLEALNAHLARKGQSLRAATVAAMSEAFAEDAPALRAAIDVCDVKEVRHRIHRIAGGLSMTGFSALAEEGKQLEQQYTGQPPTTCESSRS